MKDLDFDELDKAVNSLMTNVPKNNDSSANAPEPAERPAVSASASMPQTENTGSFPATSSPAQQSSSRQAPPASRRSGRFMDVVHPSTSAKLATPVRPVSREGSIVQPRSSQPSMAAVTPVPKPVSAASTPSVTEKVPPTSDWPDPLEMTSPKATTSAPPNTPSTAQSSSEEKPSSNPVESTPLSSPFLADAKVEKRPLGSSAPTAMSSSLDGAEDETKTGAVDDSAAQLPAMPGDVEPQMPEELQNDLMAVEADTHMGMPKTDESHPLETAAEPKKAEEKKLEAPTAPVLLEESTKTEEKPAGPPSIPQQYREEPSSGEKESGAIYDTDTYHQPLAHPAKKKSGWLWVLWIVIILLVGAGGGAALYFLGIV